MIQNISPNNNCRDNLINSNSHNSISRGSNSNSNSNRHLVSIRDSNFTNSNSNLRLFGNRDSNFTNSNRRLDEDHRSDRNPQSDRVVHHLHSSSSSKGSAHRKCIKTFRDSVDQRHRRQPGRDSGATWNVVWTTWPTWKAPSRVP